MVWNRQERHKNNQELKIEVAVFIAKVTEWMETTQDYRKQLCDKIDKIDNQLSNHILAITKKIAELPCEGNIAKLQEHNKSINRLWQILIGVVLLGIILGLWLKN